MEEKDGLIANNTYVEISLQEYCRLLRLPKGVPKAIPTMCVMNIKRDKHLIMILSDSTARFSCRR